MYLKTDNEILNLSLGQLCVRCGFKGWRVYYTTDLFNDSDLIVLFEGTKEKCQKYLEAIWTEMRLKTSNFIDTNNLYYKYWVEDSEE